MRTIKFRIKDKHFGWFYGMPFGVIKNKEFCTFVGFDNSYYNIFAEVETLGQFTGLYDKNNKEIYEGDILKDEYGRIMKVIYKENWGKFQFELIKITGEKWTKNFHFADLRDWFDSNSMKKPEIIGNIFDNPELLEN